MSTFHGPPIWIQAYVGGSPPRQCVSNYEGALMPTPLNFGIDVAKDTLQIAWAESPAELCLANRRRAIADWLAKLAPGSRIAMEATGRYDLLLAELAHAAGMIVYVLNPCDLLHYARAVACAARPIESMLDSSAATLFESTQSCIPMCRPRRCNGRSINCCADAPLWSRPR